MKNNWHIKKLKEISSKSQYGWTTKADSPDTGRVKLLRTTDITSGEVNWSSVPTCTEEPEDIGKYKLRKGDIVISRAGSVGVSYLVKENPPRDTVFASYLIRFRPTINPEYLKYYLESPTYWDFITEKSSGIALKNVNATKLNELDIRYPENKDVQNELVQKLDSLFSKLDEGEKALQQIQQQLEVYRQAVLKKSLEGNYKKMKIKEIAQVGTGATPKRGNSKYWSNGTIPWVTSTVVNQDIVTKASEYITQIALKETNVKLFPKGTLLMAMYGEGKTRGKVTELAFESSTNQAIAAINIDKKYVGYKDFLKIFLSKNYEEIRMKSAGGVQPNLNLNRIKNMEIPLPELRMAEEIVRELKSSLSKIKKIDERIKQSKNLSINLRQSILKKAFEGELV